MAIKLNVPYMEKGEAKALGAKWDPANKYWYIEDSMPPEQFSKWLGGNFGDFRFGEIALLKSARKCYKCQHVGDVYAVISKGYEIIGTNLGHKGSYKIFPIVIINDSEFWEHPIVQTSTLTTGKTMEIQAPHLICKCPKCNATHGNKYLHFVPDGVFNFGNELYKKNPVEYIELVGLSNKIVGHSYLDTSFLDHMERPGFNTFEIREENGKKYLKNVR